DVRIVRGLVEEQVMHDDQLHRREPGRDVLRVRVRLHDVLALDVEGAEGAIDSGVEHVVDAQARLTVERDAPVLLEQLAHFVVADVAIARELVREAAHVATALDVVLAAQRVHADAGTADVAGAHREVGDRDDRRGALRVLGDAETVVDRAVAAGGIEPRGFANGLRRNARDRFEEFGAVPLVRDEARPVLVFVPVAALADEGFVGEAFGDDDVREAGQHRDVGAGLERQVVRRLDVGRADEVDPARVDHDQLGALAQAALHAAGEDRVGVGRVGADHHHHVGVHDRIEVLRAGAGAERGLQAVAGRRVADARAGIDVVGAEAGADQLLHEEGFLVGAAARGDTAEGAGAVLGLDLVQLVGGVGERLVPADFAPRLVDGLADHRVEDAVLVIGIAVGEAALDARVAAVGLAVLPRDHANELLPAHLGAEGAADAAIGAGGDDRALGKADRLDALLLERIGRAGLDAGAAAHAF